MIKIVKNQIQKDNEVDFFVEKRIDLVDHFLKIVLLCDVLVRDLQVVDKDLDSYKKEVKNNKIIHYSADILQKDSIETVENIDNLSSGIKKDIRKVLFNN